MKSLAGVSVRSLVRSRRRYVLTSLGASLGVAVLFAVLVVSGASRDALDRAISGQTGRADVIISPTGAFDAVLAPGTADSVRSLEGVDTVVETIGMRSSLRAADDAGPLEDARDNIVGATGIGVGFEQLHDLDRTEGTAPAPGQPEIEIPADLARRLDLAVGDRARLATPAGPADVVVTAILADTGAATGNQGSVVFTSAETMRTMLDAPDAINGLQVDLEPGTDPARWIAEHRSALAALSVQRADSVAAGFAAFIDGVNGALTLVATIALFVGGFLVYLTFSVAVAERTRVLGTIRALGAVRRRVRRMVVLESGLFGAICAGMGLVVGYGLAVVAVGIFGALLDLDLGPVGLPVGAALFSGAVGTLVAIGAAWSPAKRAALIDPVSAMRGGSMAIERPGRRWLGPVLLTVGVAVGIAASSIALTGLGLLILLVGAVLSVHLAISPLARLAGSVMRRVSPGTGGIAIRHLERERSRSSYTLALVMVAFAAILAIGASNVAMADSLDEILDRQASAIQVGAPGALAPGVQEELAAVDGVDVLSPIRFGNTTLSVKDGNVVTDRDSFLQVIEPATYFEVSGLPFTEGDDDSARAALAAGGAVVLTSPDATALGVSVGDRVELTTVAGPRQFDVAGIYAVLGGGFGTVASTVDLETLGAGRVNGFLVGTDGADPEVVADRIRDEVGDRRQLVVDSPADTRAYATGQLSGFFSLAYAILVLTAVISLLGLANTLVVAVLDRTREIGIMRSYGARRRQIGGMVTVEAATMCAVAVVLALPLSALVGQGVVGGQRATLGADIDFAYPWRLVGPLVVAALLVAAGAAAVPARRASRLQIVESLRAE